nr:unnamed protein product [Digitaria exilis]
MPTTSSNALRDGPSSGAQAFAAASRSSRAFSRAAAPFSPATSSLVTAAISSRGTTTPLSLVLGRSAIPARSDSMTAFILCSAYRGHASIGTPAATASSVEFHPQCDTNPPTARWLRISTCGAHSGTQSPTPLVALQSLSLGNLTTHRNLCPLVSSPVASSAVCSVDSVPPLPRHTYRTDTSGCSSSHRRQPCLAFSTPAEHGRTKGPTAKAGGYTPLSERSLNAARVWCSMASKWVEQIGATEWHAPRELHGLPEVTELAGGGPVELGDVEHAGKRHEVGRAEEVSRDAELHGDLERRRAEEVGDEHGDARRGAEEEVTEVRERAVDDGEDAGLDAGVGGEVVEGHLRENGGGDGGREGGERGGVLRRGEVGEGDERGRELVAVAVRHDAARELGHGQDVASAGAREEHDVRGSFHRRRRRGGLRPHGSVRASV